jgi:hypothetical protein
MEQPTILLCNFTSQELSTLRFLLRKLPGVRILPVERRHQGATIDSLLKGTPEEKSGLIPERMALFSGAAGPFLSLLLDQLKQATKEPVLRATLTDTNRSWSMSQLYAELKAEEAALNRAKHNPS